MSEEIAKASTPESTPKVEAVAQTPAVVETPKEVIPQVEVAQPKVEEPKIETPVTPEKIELKLPEKSVLNAEHVEKITAFAKEQGLTQKQAQAILERDNQSEAARPEALKEQNKQMSESWKNLSVSDKEIGGEHFTQNVAHAQRALKQFGNDTFKKMIDETGLGNHPEVLRFFARVGKAIGNDSVVHGDTTPKVNQQSLADKFYPNMAKAQN